MKNKLLSKLSLLIAAMICMAYSSCSPCSSNVDPNYKKLAAAVNADNVALAKELSRQGAPAYDRCIGSLWHQIAHTRPPRVTSKEMIDFVDSLGLDVNYEDWDGRTALFDYNCSEEILERMLQRGADINHRRKDGHTALTSLYDWPFICDGIGSGSPSDEEAEQWAEYCKRLDLLISHGADLNILVKGKSMLDYLQDPPNQFWVRKGLLVPEKYKQTRQRIIKYLYSIEKRN